MQSIRLVNYLQKIIFQSLFINHFNFAQYHYFLIITGILQVLHLQIFLLSKQKDYIFV
jgi:hypothetical protein